MSALLYHELPQPVWHTDPDEPECRCRFSGDSADASDCAAHGETRASAVKLAPFTGEECPF